MALVVDSSQPPKLDKTQAFQHYNALDCCVTVEVWQKRLAHFGTNTWRTYLNEKDIQAPALEMQLRGLRMDAAATYEECQQLAHEISLLESYLADLCRAVGHPPVNWKSPQQVKRLLNSLGYTCKGTDRDTLENMLVYFWAQPFIRAILSLRDRAKLYDVLAKTSRDRDGRFHAAFKVAGTTTGRLSSAKDPFGEGHNLQNINERTRRVFVPDPGYKLAYIDLEQAESRGVGYLSSDENYISACESADLHTTVCRMVWPDLDWTGDPAEDKAIAEAPFYRTFSYRDMAKRLGHGLNYRGKPATMARHIKVPKEVVEQFQNAYFLRFPAIQRWHYSVMERLQRNGTITTPYGRYRRFFGRSGEDATIRKAIAHEPQSLLSDILNTGLWRIWWQLPSAQLLAQVHDAVLLQYPEEQEAEILPAAKDLLEVTTLVHGREMTIPAEPKAGWNWANYDELANPSGLKKWEGEDERQRPVERSILDTTAVGY
jgi:DNA polymerase-1